MNASVDIQLRPTREGVAQGGHIRPLMATDREPLERILVATGMFTEEEIAIGMELIDVVLENPHQQDYIINVYDDGTGPIGYYCVGPTPATDGTFDLYWIAVHPDAQGRRIGGQLDTHAADLVRSHGGRLIIAETSSQPKYAKTRQFYLSHGYAELSRIPDYYRIGDDLVTYGKYLQRGK